MFTHIPPAAAAPETTGRPCLQPPVVVFDRPQFARLVTGQVSSDIAHPDDLADLTAIIDVLDPRSREFGTDVADLVAFCLDHHALRLQDPVTAVAIHPTVLGDARDGDFLILVTVADGFALASDRLHTGAFDQHGADAAGSVLETVAATACAMHDAYQAAAGKLLPGALGGTENGSASAGAR